MPKLVSRVRSSLARPAAEQPPQQQDQPATPQPDTAFRAADLDTPRGDALDRLLRCQDALRQTPPDWAGAAAAVGWVRRYAAEHADRDLLDKASSVAKVLGQLGTEAYEASPQHRPRVVEALCGVIKDIRDGYCYYRDGQLYYFNNEPVVWRDKLRLARV